jgi:hypothetical protein
MQKVWCTSQRILRPSLYHLFRRGGSSTLKNDSIALAINKDEAVRDIRFAAHPL